MKKILSIVLCAAAVSAFADPAEVELGQVGVTAITSSNQNTIVAVSYDDLVGGTGIVVSNFVKTTNLDTDDQLAVFTNGLYETWTLVQPVSDGPKFWQKNETEFFVNGTGVLESKSGTAASLVSRSVGTGIWLIRKNPTDESGKAKPFYIYGKPSTTKTIKTVPDAWNLVGNPTQDDVTITNGIVKAANNDTILVPEAQGLVTYIYKAAAEDGKGAWCRAAGASGELELVAPTIEGGKGFWIMTAAAVDIKW